MTVFPVTGKNSNNRNITLHYIRPEVAENKPFTQSQMETHFYYSWSFLSIIRLNSDFVILGKEEFQNKGFFKIKSKLSSKSRRHMD